MEIKEQIREQAPEFLEIAGNGKSYVCPVCGSGSGAKGSGMTTRDGIHWKCWGCDAGGDVLDLWGLKNNVEDYKEQLAGCMNFYGITEGNEKPRITTKTPGAMPKQTQPEELTDFTDFFRKAQAANTYEYLQERGISKETQDHFHVGYIEAWTNPARPDKPSSPRCIIPRSRYGYLARDTREDSYFPKLNAGMVTLCNAGALKKEVCFVVEGEIDALSVYEAGADAVALCSTSNWKKLLDAVEKLDNAPRLVLMLDNDEDGTRTQDKLAEGLDALGIAYAKAQLIEKDANAELTEDPEAFKKLVSSLRVKALQANHETSTNKYNAAALLDYFRTIEQQPAGLEIKTGFPALDNENKNLYGGLHEGLYIIGAISSLGKTTFCLQLADQIAERGQDVIFFSLEQSKYELMAKSISRNTYKLFRDKQAGGQYLAKETAQVLNNKRYRFYKDEEKQAIAEAVEAYDKQAQRLFIYEGRYLGKRLTVHNIRQIVKDHVEATGNIPVVFVDYLQILGTPEDFRGTDKQAVDLAVTELKEISRDYKTNVFCISSFNRESYTEPVSMTSFKESGAVEYSSDVLFGLQYAGMDYLNGESKTKRDHRIREQLEDIAAKKREKRPVAIQLKCLKNRNGNLFSVSLNFVHAFNSYEERDIEPHGIETASAKRNTVTL